MRNVEVRFFSYFASFVGKLANQVTEAKNTPSILCQEDGRTGLKGVGTEI